jgi:hypothetical protein
LALQQVLYGLQAAQSEAADSAMRRLFAGYVVFDETFCWMQMVAIRSAVAATLKITPSVNASSARTAIAAHQSRYAKSRRC